MLEELDVSFNAVIGENNGPMSRVAFSLVAFKQFLPFSTSVVPVMHLHTFSVPGKLIGLLSIFCLLNQALSRRSWETWNRCEP